MSRFGMPTVEDQDRWDEECDRAYDAGNQPEFDEGIVAKRQACRFSPEEMSLQDARIEGAKAGHRGTAAALNPYQHTEPEHTEWERARMEALSQAVA